MRKFLRLAIGGGAAASMLWSAAAAAQTLPACDTLPDEPGTPITKIYIENGDTQEFMIKRLGKALMASSSKLRIVYRNRPTCNIRNDLFTDTTMITVTDPGTPPVPRPVKYIPVDAAFDPTKAAPVCTVPDNAPGPTISLGIGATYLSSCAQTPAQPAGITVYDGPVQAYGFITSKQATAQAAITAEEAYLAYGFAEAAGDAGPWTVQNLRFKRGNTASTTLTMAAAIKLKPSEMKAAADSGTSDALIASVVASTNFDATLGILGMDLYDQHRADIKLLAFKTFGQKYAYFPDKTSDTFDKQNVRDGHYAPWSPTPYIAKSDSNGIIDPNAKRVYELVLGTRASDDVDGLGPVTASGLIPRCAMKVNRAGDGADLTLYDDPAPCGCYFDKNVPKGSTTCTACTDNTPCGAGKCRLGFCEAK